VLSGFDACDEMYGVDEEVQVGKKVVAEEEMGE
jgi:hypothetical protein